jgi:2-C-methyl-D-erythritol 2,4-cyclodiphosphate synthase
VGQGFDVHAFVYGRRLVIGGVAIPFDRGLSGHSDADPLLHSICDACLGAAGLGDIGRHFSDTDERWRDADSREILRQVRDMLAEKDYVVANVDSTVVCQRPKVAEFVPLMRARIAADLAIGPDVVNVKATTTERLGFTGREEGIAAHAIVLLQRIDR